jgi:hypothetical protein
MSKLSKSAALKKLETVMSKLTQLNFQIQGNHLHDAIREVAYVRDKVQSGDIKP